MPRLTSHGEVCYESTSTLGPGGKPLATHPYWGEHAAYWDGPAAAPKPGCSACGSGPPTPAEYLDLSAWAAAGATDDIRGHMGTLRELAARCGRVTELSAWLKSADLALAAGVSDHVAPGTFTSVCPAAKPQWGQLARHLGERFRGVKADPHAADIEPTDLLFVDTAHTGPAVYDLLARHHGKVSRYMAVHCTATYGENGDRPDTPGVMAGVRRFLQEHREWTAVRHDPHNHGLIVLSRDDRDKQTPPGVMRKALNFTKALARHAAAGQRLVSDRVFELRMAKCLTCDQRVHDTCGACGCPVDKKCSWASEECGMTKLGREPKWRAAADPADLA